MMYETVVNAAVTNDDGYVHVAKIPAAATEIEFREHSNNYIGADGKSLIIIIIIIITMVKAKVIWR